jgi:hypothetical protein
VSSPETASSANLHPEKPAPEPEFYRPDETRRLELARRWLAVARGIPPEPKE